MDESEKSSNFLDDFDEQQLFDEISRSRMDADQMGSHLARVVPEPPCNLLPPEKEANVYAVPHLESMQDVV